MFECLSEGKWKEDFRKDFHLVRAALAADQTILSNEINFPRYLSLAARAVRILSTLYYGNPASEDEPLRRMGTKPGLNPKRPAESTCSEKAAQRKAHQNLARLLKRYKLRCASHG
jgi:hypothetical protein